MNQRISGTYDNIPLSCNKSDRQSASKAKVATFQISFSFSTTRGRVYHLLSVFMNIYDAAGVTSPGGHCGSCYPGILSSLLNYNC